MPRPWVTFDCYGTLVDWNAGFSAILRPLIGSHTAELIRAYHHFERLVEAERPHRLYRDVLIWALLRAAASLGVSLSEAQARTVPESWASLPVFDDVEDMLADLCRMNCRLAVLTNCDEDLFEATHRHFQRRFDLVVTAERLREYKPSLAHFRHFAEISHASPHGWVHVACSWYHDIEPARKFGIPAVWLDRENSEGDPSAASAHVHRAVEICPAVRRLFQNQVQ